MEEHVLVVIQIPGIALWVRPPFALIFPFLLIQYTGILNYYVFTLQYQNHFGFENIIVERCELFVKFLINSMSQHLSGFKKHIMCNATF